MNNVKESATTGCCRRLACQLDLGTRARRSIASYDSGTLALSTHCASPKLARFCSRAASEQLPSRFRFVRHAVGARGPPPLRLTSAVLGPWKLRALSALSAGRKLSGSPVPSEAKHTHMGGTYIKRSIANLCWLWRAFAAAGRPCLYKLPPPLSPNGAHLWLVGLFLCWCPRHVCEPECVGGGDGYDSRELECAASPQAVAKPRRTQNEFKAV